MPFYNFRYNPRLALKSSPSCAMASLLKWQSTLREIQNKSLSIIVES